MSAIKVLPNPKVCQLLDLETLGRSPPEHIPWRAFKRKERTCPQRWRPTGHHISTNLCVLWGKGTRSLHNHSKPLGDPIPICKMLYPLPEFQGSQGTGHSCTSTSKENGTQRKKRWRRKGRRPLTHQVRLSWASGRHRKMGRSTFVECKMATFSGVKQAWTLNFENSDMAHQLQLTLFSVPDSCLYMFPLKYFH